VGMSKSSVFYRLNRLEEMGIILGYPTIVNVFKLGFSIYQFNISMQFVSPAKEEEIIDYFSSYDYSWNTATTKGKYDLLEAVLVRNPNEFYSFYEKTLKKYRYYFKDILLSQLFETFSYEHSILSSTKATPNIKKDYELRSGEKSVDIDPIDYKILCLLSTNSRMPTIEIANKLDISSATVITHIKKLIRSKVILKYSINIDTTKLGYKTFIVRISLRDYKKKNKIIDHLSLNPFIWEIRKAIGNCDIEVVFFSTNFEHFHQMMKTLRTTFPDDISDYDYLYVTKYHRLNALPQHFEEKEE
jgi:Lrp/AsnC family transcriptional regulator for asnA, asnC and gidA